MYIVSFKLVLSDKVSYNGGITFGGRRMRKYRNPLSKTFYIGCIILVFFISSIIASIGIFMFRKGMYIQYESHLGDVIKLVESFIDTEDMQYCLDNKTETEKFSSFVHLLGEIQKNYSLDSIVISRPVKLADRYDIMYITSGFAEAQKKGEDTGGFPPLQPGDYMGGHFPPEIVERIYNDYIRLKQIEFKETPYDRGRSYNALYTVRDSDGNPAVYINSGMPVNFIHDVMRHYLISIVLAAILVCAFVLLFIISWLKNRILKPLNMIEEAARALEEKCHVEKDPEKIGLSIPKIESGDELEALTDTLSKMSENIKHFIRSAIKAAVELDSLQHDLGETQLKAQHLEELAIKDALTGIRNKTAYDGEVKKIAGDLEHGKRQFGVVMIDLNYLKRINDTFGHEKGNLAIIKLCGLVCEIFAHSPVFRIGGDEFVVILRNSDYERREALVQKINDELDRIQNTEGLPDWEKTSAAIGYAIFDESTDDGYDSVFHRADQAMYERKKAMRAERE